MVQIFEKRKEYTPIEAFEKCLPMRKITIEQWEEIVKGSRIITRDYLIDELRKSQEIVGSMIDEKSIFYKIITECDILQDKNGQLSRKALLLWGMLYCKGDLANKARVFYEAL